MRLKTSGGGEGVGSAAIQGHAGERANRQGRGRKKGLGCLGESVEFDWGVQLAVGPEQTGGAEQKQIPEQGTIQGGLARETGAGGKTRNQKKPPYENQAFWERTDTKA